MTDNVQFDEWRPPKQDFDRETPRLVRLVIKFSGGLVKDEHAANIVLVILSVAFFVTTIYLFITNLS